MGASSRVSAVDIVVDGQGSSIAEDEQSMSSSRAPDPRGRGVARRGHIGEIPPDARAQELIATCLEHALCTLPLSIAAKLGPNLA